MTVKKRIIRRNRYYSVVFSKGKIKSLKRWHHKKITKTLIAVRLKQKDIKGIRKKEVVDLSQYKLSKEKTLNKKTKIIQKDTLTNVKMIETTFPIRGYKGVLQLEFNIKGYNSEHEMIKANHVYGRSRKSDISKNYEVLKAECLKNALMQSQIYDIISFDIVSQRCFYWVPLKKFNSIFD